jgi:O-antigen ligase
MTKKGILPLSFEAILIFLIIFTPIFYGSLNPLSLAVSQFIILLLFGLWIIKLKVSESPKLIYPSYIYLLLIFLSIAIFQIIPLPEFLVKIISPKTASLYKSFVPHNNQQGFLSLAFYTLAAKKEIIKFISGFILFLVSINLIKKKVQFQRLLSVIILWGLALSFYGLISKYYVFGKEVTGSFSTFGNRNHFAGYMVMIVPLTAGYALACKDRLVKLLISFVAAVISAAVFLSLSRAGSISLIFSLLVMALLLKPEGRIQGKYWIIIVTVVLSLGLILIPGIEPMKQRFSLIVKGLLVRLEIARNSLAVIKDFPVFGVGLGNFSYIFTYYERLSSSAYFIKYLHNEHLQLVIEAGFLGAFFYFYFLYRILREILKKFKSRRDIFVKGVVAGGFCGLLAVMVHSFFEFNFHIPVISFLFWLILGLIYKCVHTHFYESEDH